MKPLLNLILIFIFSLSLAKAQPGSIDWSFQTDFDFAEGDFVSFVGFQPDGKIIVKGSFVLSLLNGIEIENILRLEKNGEIDLSFKPRNVITKSTEVIAILPDGKILIHQIIDRNKPCERIDRLNADGSKDFTFITACLPVMNRAYTVQTNGKLIIARSNINQKNLYLVRLNKDGSNDTTFKNKPCSFDNSIETVEILKNGKMIVTGWFKKVNARNQNQIARINFNGDLDTTFNPGNLYRHIFFISKIKEQPEAKLLVVGYFLSKDSVYKNIMRIDSNGVLDTTFKLPNKFNAFINSVYLQKDGKIIIGGNNFIESNRPIKGNIIRIQTDGNIDTTFKTGIGFNAGVSMIIPYIKDKIIVAGNFSSFNSYLFSRIIRLNLEKEDSIYISSILTFSISPNPSTGNFKISSSQSINLITIIDAIGKEILRTEPMAFDAEIDLSDKAPGLYFVKVFSETGSKCQKILKQ